MRWLRSQNDLPSTLGFYCELARKFLMEGKAEAAKMLLTSQLC